MARRSLNRSTLIGRLGNDPELRTFPDGGAVANVRLATSDSWKDKTTGEAKEATEWHNITFRNKLAEVVAKHLKKGSKIYVEGPMRTRKWTDKNGVERYTTEIHVDEMEMLDGKPSGATDSAEAADQSSPAGGPAPAGYGDDDPPL